jgi:hypothetical protein
MEEACSVLARLERVEALDRAGAPVPVILAELRALVDEAEEWLRVEACVTHSAERAVERLRAAVESAPPAAGERGRTLLA